MTKIGFIGFGRMGSALAEGAVAAKVIKSSKIIAYDPDKKARDSLKKLGARSAENASQVVASSQLIFICVKPQMMNAVLSEIGKSSSPNALIGGPGKRSESLDSRFRTASSTSQHYYHYGVGRGNDIRKKCFVSIAAGVPLAALQRNLGKGVPILRVMPNTPALLGAGMSVVSRGRYASPKQEARVKKILASVGKVVSMPERFMDAVTAISGSGPAYVFYMAEALIKAAQKLGLHKKFASTLVHQTMYGGGLMLAKRSEPADDLRRQVTSPGGTTAAATAVFDKQNLKQLIWDAVERAAERSAELAKS